MTLPALAEAPARQLHAGSCCDEDWQSDHLPTIQVFEDEAEPIDTGLLDQHGIRIYRRTERLPIGFCR